MTDNNIRVDTDVGVVAVVMVAGVGVEVVA